jgi:6-phosphofructokinase 1
MHCQKIRCTHTHTHTHAHTRTRIHLHIQTQVNYCFIPEVPFYLDAFLAHLKHRLLSRGHAVIVVAEGAGQHLLCTTRTKRDASGNVQHGDIGLYLKGAIQSYLEVEKVPSTLKYIDPSYIIRSVPANTQDRLLSDRFARAAVHAAMAGKTGIVVGGVHNSIIHVPVDAVCSEKKRICPTGDMWSAVLMCTGQH